MGAWIMNPQLRAALLDATRDEWADEPELVARFEAVIQRTPDGPISPAGLYQLPSGQLVDHEPAGDYETNDDHIITMIEYYGLGHLA